MRLQTLTRKFPTERPPDTENGSPGTVGTVTGAEHKGHLSDQARRNYPSQKSSASLARLFAANGVLTIYDGRQLAGVVTRHGNSYEAHDASGALLGRFQSQREAVAAIPAGGAP